MPNLYNIWIYGARSSSLLRAFSSYRAKHAFINAFLVMIQARVLPPFLPSSRESRQRSAYFKTCATPTADGGAEIVQHLLLEQHIIEPQCSSASSGAHFCLSHSTKTLWISCMSIQMNILWLRISFTSQVWNTHLNVNSGLLYGLAILGKVFG